MSDIVSKYAENQFDSATVGQFPLMSEILTDSISRLIVSIFTHPGMAPAQAPLQTAVTNWNGGETVLANAEATQISGTALLDDKFATLQRKPDLETNSLLEAWDSTIRANVPYQGSIYTLLLPGGREMLTTGTIEAQLDALRDFGVRLSNQATKPALVSLGTTVTTFATAARALRTTQTNAKAALINARAAQELLRVAAAAELLSMVGLGLQVFKATPLLVDTLFSVSLLRGAVLNLPDAPADTLWTPATRTLSTTAMPVAATRLEVWRQGPGGAPERLVVGAFDEISLVIPAAFTFDHGKVYQLWLVAINSRGSSAPGPITDWTAP